MIARGLLVGAVSLLLAVQVVRNAAVDAFATLTPDSAAVFWSGHPAVEISRGLADIGRSARERRPIAPQTFALINDAAAKAPLAAEPLLVRGVQAQTSGDTRVASRAFVAAQWRDPRSLPAAYFLADYYFRVGRELDGLQQTALLARLSPGGLDAVAPFVAAYARDPKNWPAMRSLFASQEGLDDPVLATLAKDPRNADAVLALADAQHRTPKSPWLPVLVNSLVASGDYGRARAIWASIGRARDGGRALVYDQNFSDATAPTPFNWELAGATVGLAERQPGGRLHIVYYGNVDGALASQLVQLPAGSYRLQMHILGSPAHPEAIQWSIRCEKAPQPIATALVADVARRGWTFQVPANCPAQRLELTGRSGDVAQQSELTIGGLTVTRAGGNA